jgi:hypothetical protein
MGVSQFSNEELIAIKQTVITLQAISNTILATQSKLCSESNTVQLAWATPVLVPLTTSTMVWKLSMNVAGKVRFRMKARGTVNGAGMNADIYKNGASSGQKVGNMTLVSNGVDYQMATSGADDVLVAVGDQVYISAYATGGTVTLKDFELCYTPVLGTSGQVFPAI